MALNPFLLTFNPARPAVDDRGIFTKEVADALTRLFAAYNTTVNEVNAMTDALDGAAYLSVSSRVLGHKPEPRIILQGRRQ